METKKSLNVIGTAIAVSIVTSSVVCWAQTSLNTPIPSAQQTANRNAETEPAVKELNNSLMAVVQKEKDRQKTSNQYDGMANWFGDDLLSRSIKDGSDGAKRMWSAYHDNATLQEKLRQAVEKQAHDGGQQS